MQNAKTEPTSGRGLALDSLREDSWQLRSRQAAIGTPDSRLWGCYWRRCGWIVIRTYSRDFPRITILAQCQIHVFHLTVKRAGSIDQRQRSARRIGTYLNIGKCIAGGFK